MRAQRIRRLRRALLSWSADTPRPLPWRGERDPWRVLVSEVMLQQTQASRIAAAYPSFISRFPTAAAMAESPVADVLRAWAGLGYNRRAVQLHRAAQAIVRAGGFPSTAEELEALPGVGPYTARAVASFALGIDAAPVDANVKRVLSRLSGRPPAADVRDLADALVPPGASAAWNQALMDLGSAVCTPRAPRCAACPLRGSCCWARGRRPASEARRPVPPFASTTRYARGRVVDALRSAPDGLTYAAIVERTDLSDERVRRAVASLERDGIVHSRSDVVGLGDGVPSAAGVAETGGDALAAGGG